MIDHDELMRMVSRDLASSQEVTDEMRRRAGVDPGALRQMATEAAVATLEYIGDLERGDTEKIVVALAALWLGGFDVALHIGERR